MVPKKQKTRCLVCRYCNKVIGFQGDLVLDVARDLIENVMNTLQACNFCNPMLSLNGKLLMVLNYVKI